MIFTISINVFTNHNIWYLSLFYWDWAVTKWAYWHVDILKIMNIRYSRFRHSHKRKRYNGVTHLKAEGAQTLVSDTHEKVVPVPRINSKAP